MSFSKLNCMAKVISDPEERQTNNGSLATFSIVTASDARISCSCFGNLASNVVGKIKKNDIVFVNGVLGIYTAKPQDGEQYGKKLLQLRVNDFYLLNEMPHLVAMPEDRNTSNFKSNNNQNTQANTNISDVFEAVDPDDEIPF